MIKKLNIGLALMLVFVLTFSVLTPAFGAGDPVEGSEDSPVAVAITKNLLMPKGTTTPNADFHFLVEKISKDGSTAKTEDMPLLGTDTGDGLTGQFTISYASTETGDLDTDTNIITFMKQTGDIFTGATFETTGEYVYKITEVNNSYTLPTPPPTEVMTYSPAEYTLTVYIKSSEDGSFNYVYAVSAMVDVPDLVGDDEPEIGDKVDPTPGGGGLAWTNTFVRTQQEDDPENEVLSMSKAVTGEFGDRTYYFPFSATVIIPTLAEARTYNAYIIDVNDAVVSFASLGDANMNAVSGAGLSDGPHGGTIAVTSGTPFSFKLKDGQKLIFTDLPVGTQWGVTESGTDNYIPSYLLV
ncbi:MAG: hypothetical protein FWE87_01195, partial [Coriobacteriia bacterium]|nr:hypothetical protein [Coriobacteriia bacterium]